MIQEALAGEPGYPLQEGYDPSGFAEKVGFYTDPDSQTDPASRIQAGFDRTPVLFVGGLDDPFCAGDRAPIPEAAAAGFDNNCDWMAADLADVLSAQPDSPHQLALFEGEGHVPTIHAGPAQDVVDAFIDNILQASPPLPFGE